MIRLLGRQNQELEKRIIISYFVSTLLLIVVLLIFEWRLAQYGISQYEEININNFLTEFNIKTTTDLLSLQDITSSFVKREDVVRAVKQQDPEALNRLLTPDLENLVICNLDREIWYGINWQLIDLYLPQIFRFASQNKSGSFIAALNRKLYLMAFAPVLTQNNAEMIGISILTKKLDMTDYNLRSTHRIALLTFETELNFDLVPELDNSAALLSNIINDMIDTGEKTQISKLNRDFAVGLLIFYNLENKPSGLFVLSYQRFVNSFVQQSILLFILILISISLLMLTLMGNWFSRAILLPLKTISNKMKEIASQPSELGSFDKEYSGVLGEMVNSFNTMNIALTNYGKTLKEYKMVIDNIETGIFWLDEGFNIILCNPGFQKILHENKLEKILGQNLAELLGIDDKIKFQVLAGINTFPVIPVKLSGKTKYVVLTIRADQKEKDTKFFGSITDITKETKAIQAKEALELELIKSNKLAEIGRNIEGIVHNLNSPLNSILGYTQLIYKNHPEIEDLNKVLQAGKAATRIVKGLLDKAQKSNAVMIHPVNINDIIENELELSKHNLFFKHYVILEKELQPDLSLIMANYGDLSLCIANLLNNAFEAMKDSAEKVLKISTKQTEKEIIIEIEDSGEGISPDNLTRIFEVNFTTKHDREGSGFGLGLAISKRIVERLNGHISVKSTPGIGSIFLIHLPLTKRK